MKKRAKTFPRGPDDPLPSGKQEATAGHGGSQGTAVSVAPEAEVAKNLGQTGVGPQVTVASNQPIVLHAVITIAEAAELKELLLPHSNRQGEVKIDASRVAVVDTAGLQVLLAFVRALQKDGTVVRWTGISDALKNTAQLLGVAGQLGLET